MTALDRLTPRQRQVAHALAQGGSRAEVAARLCIEDVTLRNHITAINQRLGTRTTRAIVGLVAQRDDEKEDKTNGSH